MTADVLSIDSHRNVGSVKGLLKSLVPRANCFCFYDLGRSCSWSSDGADDYELDNFIADLPDEILEGREEGSDFLRRTLPSGRTVLLLSVRQGEQALGVLVAVFSRNAGKSSWFNPSLLKNILLPVVDVISGNLLAEQRLARADQRAAAAEKELKLVYQLDEKVHGASRSHSGLAQLVGQSGRFLGSAYSVLLLPAKRIRISATHSSWKGVDRKSLDRYLIDTLIPKLRGQRDPVVYEVPPTENSAGPAESGYQVMLCPLVGANGNVEGALGQFARVSGEPFSAGHIRFMSHIVRKAEHVIARSFDPMTGLMNRAGFEAQIGESLKSLESASDTHQLVYFDLDNLHLLNDTFGQAAGDEVIKRFAKLLEDALPKNGVATRLTGDDFVVMLTHCGEQDALEFASGLRGKSDELRYLRGDRSLQVTVSAGVAACDRANDDASEIIRAARIACDAAKDHGRDRVEVYDARNQSIIRRFDDMQLVSDIQQALDNDAFELLAQPIVSLGEQPGPPRFEILLRMHDANGERVASQAFFSAAERYQLMPQIDRWVVCATLSCLAEVREQLADSGAVFAVNLSGQSLGDDDIRRFIEDEIDASGIAPGSLSFEVTESAAVANHRKAQAFIDSLRERGCRFSLDDFGAGLSSFAYLKSFRVDTLKIDGSFIRDLTGNRISESMVAAITQVARVMELDTVAEFVEDQDTIVLLRKLGVDFAQGHALGRPMPFRDALSGLDVGVSAGSG